jgi:hypothetical protein
MGTICFISNGRKTKEKAIDVNLKAYKTRFRKIFGGLSYRRSFDGAEFCKAVQFLNKTAIHHANCRVNFDKFMFAYTYSQLSGG